jgi:hypothetical protein
MNGEWVAGARLVRTVNRLGAVRKQVSCRKKIGTGEYLLPIPEGMIAVVEVVDRVGCG